MIRKSHERRDLHSYQRERLYADRQPVERAFDHLGPSHVREEHRGRECGCEHCFLHANRAKFYRHGRRRIFRDVDDSAARFLRHHAIFRSRLFGMLDRLHRTFRRPLHRRRPRNHRHMWNRRDFGFLHLYRTRSNHFFNHSPAGFTVEQNTTNPDSESAGIADSTTVAATAGNYSATWHSTVTETNWGALILALTPGGGACGAISNTAACIFLICQ
jgi:hypothetical protein